MKNTKQTEKYHTYFTWIIWSWYVKQSKKSKNRCKKLEFSVTITMRNLDLKILQRLYSERKISSLTKFNTWLQKRNTRARTRENLQVPRDWRKWGHATSTNERKIEEGIHQEITNYSEILAECQEWNYSNWSISCTSIKIQDWNH